MTIIDDKEPVQIKISESATGTDIENLILDLAELRGEMDPPVTTEKPVFGVDKNFHFHNNPEYSVDSLPDGGVRLYFRCESIGWQVFELPSGFLKMLR